MATTMGETVSSSALVVPLDQPPTDENLVPQVVVGDALALDQPLGGNAVPQVLVGEEVVAMVQPRAGNELPQVVVGDEPCVDRFSCHKPFSSFTRFIPSIQWNEDERLPLPSVIFWDNGERHKNQVKNDFDWCHASVRSADLSNALMMYTLIYHFDGGFMFLRLFTILLKNL